MHTDVAVKQSRILQECLQGEIKLLSFDRGEVGFERYIALGILGRNLHVLGKILIAKEASLSAAAHSLRRPIAT